MVIIMAAFRLPNDPSNQEPRRFLRLLFIDCRFSDCFTAFYRLFFATNCCCCGLHMAKLKVACLEEKVARIILCIDSDKRHRQPDFVCCHFVVDIVV